MLKKYIAPLVLALVILCMMGSSLWSPGGILLLDYVLTPHSIESTWWSAIVFPIMDGLSRVLGYSIVSKVFFAGTLVAAAYLGVLLARRIGGVLLGREHTGLEIIGGVFFLTNPFAYERMMVQPVIYLGIILLGYMIYFLCSRASWKKWLIVGILGGMAMNLFLHASFMIALIFGLYMIFFVRTKKELLGILGASILVVILNLNWMLAPLFGATNSAMSVGTFDFANLEAFMTESLAPMNVWWTNILLYGFWGERYGNHYANVGFLSSLWYIAGLLLFALMAVGKWRMWQKG